MIGIKIWFEVWIRAFLDGLCNKVYGEYVKGIVADTETELEERCSTAVDILRAVLGDDAALDTMAGELQAKWTEHELEVVELKAQELEKAKARHLVEKMEELKLVELNKQAEADKAQARSHMSKEELQQREKILRDYGAVGDSEFDEDGNVIFKGSQQELSAVNTNRGQGKVAQQELRDKMKKEHDAKVKREKELLEADRLRKDKAQKRTQKREKQRGCG
ncbi:hypothetical protein DYB25_009731 [Aphanomyces astaci]|uniref:Coiled-coil domain-containing protein 43 n=2 Tax=Aphanomyces astaci TaxID=112090 RepID=A0A397BF35_APHAT|nr:hypothetical protein DYB36_004847 [Aphanomyces astaci]RHY17142.1 hypothetical protein DYB25_009731 [Aphanomyces astaci]